MLPPKNEKGDQRKKYQIYNKWRNVKPMVIRFTLLNNLKRGWTHSANDATNLQKVLQIFCQENRKPFIFVGFWNIVKDCDNHGM